jgi:hypothetical protein
MSSKILAIFDRELTKSEIDALSGVCFDMEIEEVEEDSSQRISSAFLQEFGIDSDYQCYLFHTEEIQPGMFLAGIQADYMGRWNEEDLERIESLADFYENTETNINDLGSLYKRSRNHNADYEDIFGESGSVNLDAADEIETQFEQDYCKIREAIENFFSERKLV